MFPDSSFPNALVADPEFGERLLALAARAHVLVVDSRVNRPYAEQLWQSQYYQASKNGTSVFLAAEASSREAWVMTALSALEFHPSVNSHDPTAHCLEIFGVTPTPGFAAQLLEYGFERITDNGDSIQAWSSRFLAIPNGTLVTAVNDGPGPLVHHMSEQVVLISGLPVFQVTELTHTVESAIILRGFAGSILLPNWPGRNAADGPDNSIQGWSWPDGESILRMLGATTGLPLLARIGVPADAQCIAVAGHPMLLTLLNDPPNERCVATVDGFLSETMELDVIVWAPNALRRAELLSAVSTLQLEFIAGVS